MFAITYWSVALSFPLIELSILMEKWKSSQPRDSCPGPFAIPQGDAVEL